MSKKYIVIVKTDFGFPSYSCGGSFKIGKESYAKLTDRLNEAKTYHSKARAERKGERLAQKCANVNSYTVQERSEILKKTSTVKAKDSTERKVMDTVTIRVRRKLLPCKKCGRFPSVNEGWDMLQIVCECGEVGKIFYGDYYDEAFMFTEYGSLAIADWNKHKGKK